MTRDQLQSEELSKAIDALNSRKPFRTADPEILQLMKTADYIKQYGRSTDETALLNQLSARISAETVSRRRQKRLLSGAAAVAAAALVFIGVSFQTPAEIAQQYEQEPISAPQVVMTEKPKVKTSVQNSGRGSELQTVKQNPAVPKVAKSAQPAEVPNREKPMTEVKPAHASQESPLVAKVAGGEKVLMVLPNRMADSIFTEAGTVRQVYSQNSDKEIVITQRPAEKAEKNVSGAIAPAAALQEKPAEPRVNKAKRIVNGVEIVVEGKQPQADLERVAESLVPADQAQNAMPDQAAHLGEKVNENKR